MPRTINAASEMIALRAKLCNQWNKSFWLNRKNAVVGVSSAFPGLSKRAMSSAAQFDLYSEAVTIPDPVYQNVLTPLSPPKNIKPSNIMGCTPINDGNQLKVQFADNN